MLANPAGYLTGFCNGSNPEAHAHCRGAVSRGSSVEEQGELTCVCLHHTDPAYMEQLLDARAWTTVDTLTGETKKWHTEAEAREYARSKCLDCGGTGAVPALGGEPEDEVDNGYVACPTCHPKPVLV